MKRKLIITAALIAVFFTLTVCAYAQDETVESNTVPIEKTSAYDSLPAGEKIQSISLLSNELEYFYDRYDKNLQITLNNGGTLNTDYDVAYSSKPADVGRHSMTIRFRGKYEGYPTKVLKYTVRPLPAYILLDSKQPDTYSKVRMEEIRDDREKAAYKIRFYISKDANMKNPIKKTFKLKSKKLYTIKGLSKGTQYYITAYYLSKGADGKTYESLRSSNTVEFKTAGKALKTPTLSNSKDIYKKLKAGKRFVLKTNTSEADATKYVKKGLWQIYPYYFHSNWSVTTGYSSLISTNDNGVTEEIIFIPPSKFSKFRKSQEAVDSIVAKAKKKKSNEAKVKYVNDRIRKICTYKNANSDSYTAYGCLLKGKAVCAGYAESFAWCMSELGIKNKYQHNKSKTHVWNKVYIKHNGETRWWHVDVTWNDVPKSNRYLLTKSHP